MNERQHIALTEAQIIAAEKGELKLETRDGRKVVQFVWLREPYNQSLGAALRAILQDGSQIAYLKSGMFCDAPEKFDLFVSEPSIIKPNKPEQIFTGFLKDVPAEIIERMLIEQEAQGNKRDASVFDRRFGAGKGEGGFQWNDTQLDFSGWQRISCGDYSEFYKLYPKYEDVAEPAKPEPKPLYEVGEIIEALIINTWKDCECVGSKNGYVSVWADGRMMIAPPLHHRKKQTENTAKPEPKPIYEVGEIIEYDTPSGWVDVEYREDRNGQVCVFSNGMYKSIPFNNLRKKQTEKTVTLDEKVMTVKEAFKYLTNLNQ